MRTVKLINEGWSFRKKEGGKSETINIPHTWNALDGQDGGNDFYRGVCVYSKEIKKPEFPKRGKVYLEFRGVNASAQVRVNNHLCKSHKGGYSTFRGEITEFLNDGINLIEVTVDNTPDPCVYPQNADFTFYGGIYRDVSLITVPESHFDLEYFGTSGIQITPQITGTDAMVTIKTYIRGDYDHVKVTIDGVTSIECGNAGSESEGILKIPKVHLWNGLDDPYLYQAKAELIVNGETVDMVLAKFGCRTFSFDTEQGFFLNGISYPLHGASRHQDFKDVGNAISKDMQEKDVELMLEMGANAVRLAHYQHDQYFYDLCDASGLIVWTEIPYISIHSPKGRENTISQMTELIAQNYNHPSIICWGLSNEITVGGITDDLMENHRILNDLAHHMDAGRVTAMANISKLETEHELVALPDIVSYNLYYGWYMGELQDNARFFDEFHNKYPKLIIGLSEYGADALEQYQSAHPKQGDYSEQYQCIYHEYMLKMFETRPYLWSTFVWNMFDFGSDRREDAGDHGVNHKGLVSFDRKIKKDAFYLYKAWWSKEPFIHLCGSRYKERTEAVTEIKVYTNQQEVSLYQDGKLVERQSGNRVFVFQVPLSGEHQIIAKSGSLTSSIQIKKTDVPNPKYILTQTEINNWLDEIGLETEQGYFSLTDRIGEIRKNPKGKELIDTLLQQQTDVTTTDTMQDMVNRMTLDTVLKHIGAAADKELIKQLNNKLGNIKKTV